MNYRLIIEGNPKETISKVLIDICLDKEKSDAIGVESLEQSREHKTMRVSEWTDEMMTVFNNPILTFEARNEITYQSLRALSEMILLIARELK
jgi:hypothetical protein